MTIQLTRQSDSSTAVLPDDCLWIDEYGWSPVSQSRETTITGSMIVEEAVAEAGRPITLAGDGAWIQRDQLERLRQWSIRAAEPMTLRLADGREYEVIFDQQNTAVEAEPLQPKTIPLAADYYVLTLRLIEV